MKTLKDIMSFNKILLFLIFGLIIVHSIVLYVLIIRKTHRISGPIYVMSMYIEEIIKGKLPNPRPLRDNDELKDFYELFKKMVDSLRDKLNKWGHVSDWMSEISIQLSGIFIRACHLWLGPKTIVVSPRSPVILKKSLSGNPITFVTDPSTLLIIFSPYSWIA